MPTSISFSVDVCSFSSHFPPFEYDRMKSLFLYSANHFFHPHSFFYLHLHPNLFILAGSVPHFHDIYSFPIISFQSKPDYEHLLKEEFEAQDIHFEANVADCLDEGRFIFELIMYSKCGQCVFECPHLGDDKILAFRLVMCSS